jgi:hypothetical protein
MGELVPMKCGGLAGRNAGSRYPTKEEEDVVSGEVAEEELSIVPFVTRWLLKERFK